jgi:hypothetical protein
VLSFVALACPRVRRPPVRSPAMPGERGQATVEWVGLVLVAACLLVGFGLGVRGSARGQGLRGEGLGEDVAARILCGARTASGEGAGGGARCPRARARGGSPPPAAAPPLTRRADGFQRLRGVSQVAKRVWVVCLGYKRLRYERDHPRTSGEPMPLDEALGIANDCFNPLGFLGVG